MAFKALMDSLEALHAVHVELLDAAREKQGAIIKNDIDTLNKLVQRESKLVKSVEQLNAERVQRLREWMLSLGYNVPATGVTITMSLAERYARSAVEKESLGREKHRLRKVVDELRSQNENNQKLLKQALQYVNFSMDLLTADPGDDMTYRPPEHAAAARKYNMYDFKG